jgi:hypothetical protein
MSSFEEIKSLLTNEIINSPQYTLAIKIKDLIKADILAPNINCNFIYTLEDSDYVDLNNKDKEEQILIMALKIVLGLDIDVSMGSVVIVMKRFLN